VVDGTVLRTAATAHAAARTTVTAAPLAAAANLTVTGATSDLTVATRGPTTAVPAGSTSALAPTLSGAAAASMQHQRR